jgi:ATP-dependent DNA helicase DinG
MNNLYEKCVKSLGLSSRPSQKKAFELLCVSENHKETTGLFQVDTGVGKTLAIALAAFDYCLRGLDGENGLQVIIATSTINLVNELEQCFDRLGPLFSEMECYPSYAKMLGKSHYVLPDAVQELIDSGDWNDSKVLLSKLLTWTAPIDEFIDAFGELPDGMMIDDVCQTSSVTRDSWGEDVDAVLNKDIIITTHAMLANDMRKSRFDAESMYLIIDEADAFVDLLESYQFSSFNLKRELGGMHHLLTKKGSDLLSDCIENACISFPKSSTYSVEERAQVKATLDCIIHAMKSKKRRIEHDDNAWLNEMKRYVEYLELSASTAKYIGCSKTDVLNEPAILMLNPYFSRIFGSYSEKFVAVSMMSGTLSINYDIKEGTKWVVKKLSLNEPSVRVGEVSPEKFGELKLSLIKIGNEMYQSDLMRSLNPEWVRHLADSIKNLSGKTLVLVASYEEGIILSKYLPKSLLHEKGDKLAKSVKDFSVSYYHFMITPVGHTGVNFTQSGSGSFLNSIVITRLGFQPPSAYLKQLKFVKNLSAQHKASLARMEYHDAVNRIIRKTKQTIGRGIRAENDSVHVYIADPRFPQSTDFTAKYSQLRYAIAKRFQSSYANHGVVTSSLIPADSESEEEIII